MTRNQNLEHLRTFLKSLLHEAGDRVVFSEEQSLIFSRVLDSLAVMKLILFLETEYNMRLDDHVHDISDLDSFAKIEMILNLKDGLK